MNQKHLIHACLVCVRLGSSPLFSWLLPSSVLVCLSPMITATTPIGSSHFSVISKGFSGLSGYLGAKL